MSAFGVDASCEDGDVLFGDRSLANLLGESVCSFAGSRDDNQSTRDAIEPADDPDIDISRLLILFFPVIAGPLVDAWLAGDPCGGETCGFVEDQKVVVFVHYFWVEHWLIVCRKVNSG